MKVRVNWDTDGEDVDRLPSVVTIPDEIHSEDVSDYLSDNYGWCVLGWTEL